MKSFLKKMFFNYSKKGLHISTYLYKNKSNHKTLSFLSSKSSQLPLSTILSIILAKRIRSIQNLQNRLDQYRIMIFHAKQEEEFYQRLGIYENGWVYQLETEMGVLNLQLSLQIIKKNILKMRLNR